MTLCLFGCAATTAASPGASESETFEELRIVGAERAQVDVASIRAHARPSGADGHMTERDLELASLWTSAALYDRGYLMATVKTHREPKPNGGGVTAVIVVEEGPQFRVGRASLDAPDTNGAVLHIKSGDVFNRSVVVKDVEAIVHDCRENGYANATIEPMTHLHAAERLVDLDLVLHRGPVVTVDRVDLDPSLETAGIRERIVIRAGDRFRESSITRSLEALSQPAEAETAAVPGHADRIVVTFHAMTMNR